ncbi:MAG: bifunctional proline dehydrogenase/L-glutamate gamma-semialdehyde dehydrogenase PutA [Thiohalomonadales bacterium]
MKTINSEDGLNIDTDYLLHERLAISQLLAEWSLPNAFPNTIRNNIQQLAEYYIQRVREDPHSSSGLQAFLLEYDLSSKEGVVLLCLAEALLRIPDTGTANSFIQDKLAKADWRAHLHQSKSLFVNTGTWGLMLTGLLLEDTKEAEWLKISQKLLQRAATPLFRATIREAMRLLGQQFILGENIKKAVLRSNHGELSAYLYSYDMLGEAAVTLQDAERYFSLYKSAINFLATDEPKLSWKQSDSISVKLSALHPRFELLQRSWVTEDLVDKLKQLILLAKRAGIGITIDAEEASRLSFHFDIYRRIWISMQDDEWDGFGIVVQAYQKRALPLIDSLQRLAMASGKKIPVRLVKGAYWDAEIKLAQEMGLDGFPVYTRKCHSDLSFLVCAKRLLQFHENFYPQFATHNPLTLSAVCLLAEHYQCEDFEWQRLHGMGKSLAQAARKHNPTLRCRVYAPVGGHKELLPYLVRRLLENGANTSFVNRIADPKVSTSELLSDPIIETQQTHGEPHPKILLSRQLFLPSRKNSSGLNFNSTLDAADFQGEVVAYESSYWHARPLVEGSRHEEGLTTAVHSINADRRVLGEVIWADKNTVSTALSNAIDGRREWSSRIVSRRADKLLRWAELIEDNRIELVYLLCHEAGKCLQDAVAEIREAVDFCRYYAQQAVQIQAKPKHLVGPTGETNLLSWHARGVFVCISPWNFPVAIFTGQIAAALVMGNTVIAKPASTTVLIAHRLVRLCYEAGFPQKVVSFLPVSAKIVAAQLLLDHDIAGVAFTGSSHSATLINQGLASRQAAIVHLIAETGGINAMIVDSSALVEQVAVDVVKSAFNSAGQRCSALRVLFIQQDIAPRLIELIVGAIKVLRLGSTTELDTDIGPLISVAAAASVTQHIAAMAMSNKLIYQLGLAQTFQGGSYVGPAVIEIEHLQQLQKEVFGPVLHIIRYDAEKIDDVLQQINDSYYGLTLGIHSRIESSVDYIVANVRVGNIYVNRDMIGAVVGVQAFGGEGLSGTGPKAGGPNYLYAYGVERMLTTNTTAIGGNASLLSIQDNKA